MARPACMGMDNAYLALPPLAPSTRPDASGGCEARPPAAAEVAEAGGTAGRSGEDSNGFMTAPAEDGSRSSRMRPTTAGAAAAAGIENELRFWPRPAALAPALLPSPSSSGDPGAEAVADAEPVPRGGVASDSGPPNAPAPASADTAPPAPPCAAAAAAPPEEPPMARPRARRAAVKSRGRRFSSSPLAARMRPRKGGDGQCGLLWNSAGGRMRSQHIGRSKRRESGSDRWTSSSTTTQPALYLLGTEAA